MTDNAAAVEQFGVHLMIDGYDADPIRLADRFLLEALLRDLPDHMGMHRISEAVIVEVGPKNRKDPGGISGFVMIAESHFSLHTFPARRLLRSTSTHARTASIRMRSRRTSHRPSD